MLLLGFGARELALLVLLSVLWSGAFTLIKVAVWTVPPASLVAGRLLLAAPILWLYMRARGESLPPPGPAWRLYALLAVTGNALPFVLISWGETRIDSGLAAILMGAMPVMTLLLAHALTGDEPIRRHRLIGIVLGFAGVVVLVGPKALAGLGGEVLAQLAVLGGGACYAANMVLARRSPAAPVPAATAVTLIGAIIIAPLAVIVDRPWTLAPAAASLAAMAGLALFSTAVATIVFFVLVARAGATATAMVNYLIPAMGFAWGVLFLGEPATPTAVLALALILAAIALVNRVNRATRFSIRRYLTRPWSG